MSESQVIGAAVVAVLVPAAIAFGLWLRYDMLKFEREMAAIRNPPAPPSVPPGTRCAVWMSLQRCDSDGKATEKWQRWYGGIVLEETARCFRIRFDDSEIEGNKKIGDWHEKRTVSTGALIPAAALQAQDTATAETLLRQALD